MSHFPPIVMFGLSFPPLIFILLLSFFTFLGLRCFLRLWGAYDFIWHPVLFNTALYFGICFLVTRIIC